MEDRIIINLFWQRDQSAIEETDNKYGETCRYIARSILTSREDAEECVDDTYMAVWDSIPPQRPVHLSAFLYRIVRNLSFNRLKERYTQKRGGGELDLALDELEDCVASDYSVERAFETKELVKEINDFLFSLSKDDSLSWRLGVDERSGWLLSCKKLLPSRGRRSPHGFPECRW